MCSVGSSSTTTATISTNKILDDSVVDQLDITVAGEPSIQDTLSTLNLKVTNQLGAGSFGSVHAAWCEETETEVAVKVVEFDEDDLDDDRQSFVNEVAAMMALGDSRYIVNIQRGALDKDAQAGVIIMERAQGPDLELYLQSGQTLETDEALWIGLRVAKAIQDIHAAGLVHRDVKSGNIFLYPCEAGETIEQAKLGDLGLVAERGESVSAVAGTLEFMPNNLVASWENEVQPPPKPCFSDDIFAFACVMLELIGAMKEFDQWNRRRFRAIKQNKRAVEFQIPERLRHTYSPDLIEALEACLDEDARLRPTAEQMVDLLSSMTSDRIGPRLSRSPTKMEPTKTETVAEAGAVHVTPTTKSRSSTAEAGSGSTRTCETAEDDDDDEPGGIGRRVKRRRRQSEQTVSA